MGCKYQSIMIAIMAAVSWALTMWDVNKEAIIEAFDRKIVEH